MDIVETLRRNHEAMRRDESPYSVAADEIERLRAVIRCEQIEPPADVTDDQTTELAVQLAYAKAEIEQLRELNDTYSKSIDSWKQMNTVARQERDEAREALQSIVDRDPSLPGPKAAVCVTPSTLVAIAKQALEDGTDDNG